MVLCVCSSRKTDPIEQTGPECLLCIRPYTTYPHIPKRTQRPTTVPEPKVSDEEELTRKFMTMVLNNMEKRVSAGLKGKTELICA